MREVITTSILYKGLTRKTAFLRGGLVVTFIPFYTIVTKGLKLKVRKIRGQIPTFVEVKGEKLVGLFAPAFPILNRVKTSENKQTNKIKR